MRLLEDAVLTPGDDDGAVTFVTVAYPPEYPLLHLQARSFARHVPPRLVREVLVVDNSPDGRLQREADTLVPGYGPLAPRVRVLHRREVATLPRTTGWRSQQVLKLSVARLVSTARYVVLDAKNHFVAPLTAAFLETPDGRPRTFVNDYTNHPLRPNFERVLRYVGLEPGDHLRSFGPTTTPFTLITEVVRALVRDVEARAGCAFPREFVRQDLTEFILYSSWLVASGTPLPQAYALDQPRCPTVWPRSADAAGVERAVEESDGRDAPLFAVHRRALAVLDAPTSGMLADFWVERGLFPSAADALRFVTEFQAGHDRTLRRQRLREAPYSVLARARRSLPQRPLAGTGERG